MNIKITHQWLLEYLDTDADPYEIQKYLSFCGPSVEKVEKVGDDFVYDIEITSNRVDSASVFGIAQEASAILPEFGKKAKLKINPLTLFSFKNIEENNDKKILIEVLEKGLISRVSAIVLKDIKIGKSLEVINKRLTACSISLINNVVDISNYLRISIGQPCHIFDYDSITGGKMIIRKSKKGEKIQTLDKDNVVLPGDDIVISDGSEKLIDQPGIMGAYNSSVKENTKNILLFVPVFNGQMVRRTSMIIGKRSDAASYFEKGLDPERIEPALTYAVELLTKYTGAKVASKIIDITENKVADKKIKVLLSDINSLIGTDIDKNSVQNILIRLGFGVKEQNGIFEIDVPSYRNLDVQIKEDIIEEIARIYGFSKVPSRLQHMEYVEPQKNTEKISGQIQNIKTHLKHIGLNEIINLSMISEDQIKKVEANQNDFLKLQNPISKDLEYLRIDLLPSLLSNVNSNQGKNSNIKIFEISNVYLNKKTELPNEKLILGIISNKSFFDLKGIIESILTNLNISNYGFKESSINFFSRNKQSDIFINNKKIGYMGSVKNQILHKFEISESVYFAQLEVLSVVDEARIFPVYKKLPMYSVVKLDLTLLIKNYEEFTNKSFGISDLLISMNIIDKYMDNLTIRFLFSSPVKNLTEKEALPELEKIKKVI